MRYNSSMRRLFLLLPLFSACAGPSPTADAPYRALGKNAQGHAEYLRARDGMTVILVPAGPYPRRSYEPRATTQEPHAVQLPAFLVDKCEVSNAQFARFLKESAAESEAAQPLLREQPWGLRKTEAGWAPQPGMEDYPAVGVTGWGAEAYASWAGAQLPSPDAWMKAAGGTEGLEYPFGGWKEGRLCNWRHAGLRRTAPVWAFPEGASPAGCLNMSGNVTERVFTDRGRGPMPVMLKGGSWVSSHPLNLRVLDLCIQPMEAAEQSVGFRTMAWVRDLSQPLPPPNPGQAPPPPPTVLLDPRPLPSLRLARDFLEGLEEARQRNCAVLLSLHFDTCGQCDRVREQVLHDPGLMEHLNENGVAIVGQAPGDAGPNPHPPGEENRCPLFPALGCGDHEAVFRDGLGWVGTFIVSPGNFILDPDGKVLVEESRLPKSGDAAGQYLELLREAQARLGPFLSRGDYETLGAALETGDRQALEALLEGKDPRIPLVAEAREFLKPSRPESGCGPAPISGASAPQPGTAPP